MYEICDRLTVLRNGKLVGEYLVEELLRIDLVQKMIGKELTVLDDLEQRARSVVVDESDAAIFVNARGPRAPRRDQSGRPADRGGRGRGPRRAARLGPHRVRAPARRHRPRRHRASSTIRGKATRLRTPRQAISHRIAFSSENRRDEGIVGDLTVRDNIVLALQADRGWFRPIPKKRQDELTQSYIQALNIRPGNPDALVRNLSGGNQQKVLLARWLAIAPRLLILDEPTRGIDIGAKAEIQKLVFNLAENGMSVLFISAELEEVLRLSHRIVVLRDRHVVADLENDGLTVDSLLALIAEGSNDDESGCRGRRPGRGARRARRRRRRRRDRSRAASDPDPTTTDSTGGSR